jgi:Ribonuclease G/E
VHLGRVTALDRGLQAAFVDVGLERPGLLPLKAAGALTEGAAVTVRVTREPGPAKGAKLAPAPEVEAGATAPPALLQAPTPLADLLRACDPAEIRIAGGPAHRHLADAVPRDLASRVQAQPGARPPFESQGLEAAIDALLEPEVDLDGGGRIRIEPVRTLTAVDVDAGGADARGGRDRQALAVDRAAAGEIARQIRLRALSGLIVVDFLDLDTKEQRKQVADALAEACRALDLGASVSPMRASGLVEISVPRTRPPLHEMLSEAVGRAGRVPDALTLAYDLLRRGEREAMANPGAQIALLAHPEVFAALDGPAKEAHDALCRSLGRTPERRPDPARPRDSLDAVPV